ncbi:hypothetical protein [Flavobacterium sp. SM2513]|uniref:hypothetical protein n=1 Tax=Flavobacterium sp. SM2513 TaxID=3424766 RepID=UPI003D7FE19A
MKKNYFVAISVLMVGFLAHSQVVPTPWVTISQSANVELPGDCTTLAADYFKIKPTTSYQVEAITYQTAFAFTGGTILNIMGDDKWSPLLELPFKFCFYGQMYQNLIVGSNGVVSFTTTGPNNTPSGYCPWQFSGVIPSTTFSIKNAIYGVYQDTNINQSSIQNDGIQNVNYYSGGVAPNRYFVANFNRIPNYNCDGSLGADYTSDMGCKPVK